MAMVTGSTDRLCPISSNLGFPLVGSPALASICFLPSLLFGAPRRLCSCRWRSFSCAALDTFERKGGRERSRLPSLDSGRRSMEGLRDMFRVMGDCTVYFATTSVEPSPRPRVLAGADPAGSEGLYSRITRGRIWPIPGCANVQRR